MRKVRKKKRKKSSEKEPIQPKSGESRFVAYLEGFFAMLLALPKILWDIWTEWLNLKD